MKKSSKTKIARIYSTALYEAAVEKGCTEKIRGDIVRLQELLRQDADFAGYLESPLWSEHDKIDLLDKTSAILKLAPETLACLKIITENHRVAELGVILDAFAKVYYRRNNIAEVEVETVKKLSATQDGNLKKILEKMLSVPVVVKYNVNPAILGGLRVKCGSQMFDDSLSAKLNYLEKVMKGK